MLAAGFELAVDVFVDELVPFVVVVVEVRVLVGLSSKFGRGRASCSNRPGTEGIIMGRIPLEGVRGQLRLGFRSPALDRTIAHWREAITDGNI